MLLLAPLFPFIRADYGVSYTELGLALTVFNVVSAVLQTPAGFLVDRIGARFMLIAGLLLGAGAFAVAALVHSFWVFIAMFGVLGLANTVYHPADYALLSSTSRPSGRPRYSRSTPSPACSAARWRRRPCCSCRACWAGAARFSARPSSACSRRSSWSCRGASGTRGCLLPSPPTTRACERAGRGWRLLMSAPILLNFVFFLLLSMSAAGLNNFLVVGLGALHGTPPAVGNTALTGLLAMSAVGVLVGGLLAGRTAHHNLSPLSGCW